MKKGIIVLLVLCCLFAIFHLGCGGSSSNQPKVSKLKTRAFVTVFTSSTTSVTNNMLIIDASKDQFSAFTISLFGTRATLTQPGANNTTLVFSSGENGISIVDNAQEKVVNANDIALPGATESMVESSDGKFIYAAIRSASQVAVADVANASVSKTITVPSARSVVLSHNNSKLLAFSDGLDTFTLIDTASNKKICGSQDSDNPSVGPCPTLSRPFYAVFSSDDSKAYILSCGPRCGGTTAMVTAFDLSGAQAVAGAGIALATPGASADFALMDSGKLYVTGMIIDPNTGSPGAGQLNIIDLGSFALANPSSAPIGIGNGLHTLISKAPNNKLFIGAQTCTTGCLSVVDLSANSALIDTTVGDVTGIAPIPNRSVVYVTQGGELRIIDSATGKPQANQLDIVGTASGVVAPQ